MTLTSAFGAVCGPGSRARDVPDAQACIVLYEELQRIARMIARDPQSAADSAATAFEKLLHGGERRLREPIDDARVRQYLRRVVRHVEIDRFRRQRHEIALDAEGESLVDTAPQADETLQQAELEAELAASRDYFHAVIVPSIAASIRAPHGAAFERAILQLTEVADERSTLDEICRREFGEVSKAARDRLYQQHCRARRYLLDWMEDELPGLNASPVRIAALKALIARLRTRSSSRSPSPDSRE